MLAWAATPRPARLDNGLEVRLLPRPGSPLVATALVYRAGARDEAPGAEGAAHLLEHLMFRGSPRFAEGEIDRRTRAVGGSSNAFTTHDATAYHFTLPRDDWPLALDIEADRMRRLAWRRGVFEVERRIVLEELAAAREHPWDALELDAAAALYGRHPYGRPVLGRRSSLERLELAAVRAFHRRHYRPGNAVLVVAGGIGRDALARVREAFGGIEGGAARRRSPPPPLGRRSGVRRLERHQGEVDRLLVALPAPAAADPDFAPFELLLTLLAAGRSGRLHLSLVERRRLATWVEADLDEAAGPGMASLAAEAAPGADPAALEAEVLAELERLRGETPVAAEIERARRMLLADWAIGCERLQRAALVAGEAAAALDAGWPRRHLRRLLTCRPRRLAEVARRWLDPGRGAVVARSLAADGGAGRK